MMLAATTIPVLGPIELALAALLLVVNGLIIVALRLGLERRLALAAFRMVVQLLLVGVVLGFVFRQSSWHWTALVSLVMIAVATFEVRQRPGARIGGWFSAGLGGMTLLLVGGLATVYAVAGIIGAEPWYAPRTLLPILGMILGNTLTGVSLAFGAVADLAKREARAIEAHLAHGATRWQAFGGGRESGADDGAAANDECDVGCRRCFSARDDDGTNPRRR